MIPDPDQPGTETGPERGPWERRPDESAKAFGAFVQYRDLGFMRTLKAAAVLLYGTGECTPAQLSQFKAWSTKNDWVARAEAWDDYLDAVNRAQQAADVVEMNRVQATTGRNVLTLVNRQLREWSEALDADGNAKSLGLSPSELARLLEVSVKVERLARGEATTVTAAQAAVADEDHDAAVQRANAMIDEVEAMRQRREAAGG